MSALRYLGGQHRPLHIIDIGAGAGEGFSLLSRAVERAIPSKPFTYTGIDASRAMLDLAAAQMDSEVGATELVHADMIHYDFSSCPADLYMSTGAPYSELTERQLCTCLTRQFHAIERSSSPSVVIVDVYGTNCLAWLPVAAPRRTYTMSFFLDTKSPPTREMRFYVPSDLGRIFHKALTAQAWRRLDALNFYDRSIFSSRHTTTGLYNADLPPLRTILNEILGGHRTHRLVEALHIPSKASSALERLQQRDKRSAVLLEQLIRRWNRRVQRHNSPPYSPLLHALHDLNSTSGRKSVGVGHYLTMVAFFKGVH
ncbi:class I SAM-dependent methyltransferase [Streptomyces sp. NPDC054833]